MTYNKLSYITCIYLVVFSTVMAGQYVPPPSGPYKSSALVFQDFSQPGNAGQVYKFPSDSLIQQTRPVNPVFFPDNKPDINNIAPSMAVVAPVRQSVPPAVNKLRAPETLDQTRPPAQLRQSQFYSNPWAVNSLSNPAETYQGYWNNQQQNTYPQQNQYGFSNQQPGQYGYSNQNNYMNGPFNGMPSPWSAMPMQPFFSGK